MNGGRVCKADFKLPQSERVQTEDGDLALSELLRDLTLTIFRTLLLAAVGALRRAPSPSRPAAVTPETSRRTTLRPRFSRSAARM
jgi:hypothetical protein